MISQHSQGKPYWRRSVSNLFHKQAEFGGRVRFWQWHEDTHEEMRIIREYNFDRLEYEVSNVRMLKFSGKFTLVLDLMQRPPLLKFRTYRLQLINQRCEPGILDMLHALHTE